MSVEMAQVPKYTPERHGESQPIEIHRTVDFPWTRAAGIHFRGGEEIRSSWPMIPGENQ